MSTITPLGAGESGASSRVTINDNLDALNTDKIETSVLDTDVNLTADSDAKIATQKAVKAYVDTGGGTANASVTVKGLVEEATAAEVAAGTATGGTGARLFVNPSNLLPPGIIMQYAGATAPSAWLVCDGSAVSRATYASLFTAIGTTYGVGDGASTFNIPDLRGRTIAGLDNMGGSSANRVTSVDADSIGGVYGSETHTLTVAEMPSHTHTVTPLSGNASADGIAAEGAGQSAWAPGATTSSSTGSDTAHNNMQPTMFMNFIIKF